MHEPIETPERNIVGLKLSGTLTEEDLDALVPHLKHEIERLTTARLFFELDDVDGWEPESRWHDEFAFDVRHARDVDKIAVVSDTPWETWTDTLTGLFRRATIRTFPSDERGDALGWLSGDMDVPGIGPGSVSDPDAGPQDDAADNAADDDDA